MKQCNMYDFQSRIDEENVIISQILRDMTNVYKLVPGCRYQVQLVEGGGFEGYFRHLEVRCFLGTIYIRIVFYKVKKDGTSSKVETSARSGNIQDIIQL